MTDERARQLRAEFAEQLELAEKTAAVLSRPWKVACCVLVGTLAAVVCCKWKN